MKEISPATPLVGLTSIQRTDVGRATQGAGPEERAAFVGSTIRQNVRSLYSEKTVTDTALELTVPHGVDPELLQPGPFAAAFLDAADKVQADHEDAEEPDGLASRVQGTLLRIRKATEHCWSKIAGLYPA
ncbi:MAG: hypothetical protein AAGG06_16620 [Pseudomonadota bacterium]